MIDTDYLKELPLKFRKTSYLLNPTLISKDMDTLKGLEKLLKDLFSLVASLIILGTSLLSLLDTVEPPLYYGSFIMFLVGLSYMLKLIFTIKLVQKLKSRLESINQIYEMNRYFVITSNKYIFCLEPKNHTIEGVNFQTGVLCTSKYSVEDFKLIEKEIEEKKYSQVLDSELEKYPEINKLVKNFNDFEINVMSKIK